MPELPLKLGVALNDAFLTATPAERRGLLGRMESVGLDHFTCGDHLSFHGGAGFDGFVAATAALATSDRLDVQIGVYLAGLRHPMATARSLATLSQIAPGRLTLGVGVAGEDRAEVSNMGVDPTTRGRRLDETLTVLGRLATGESVDFGGQFFALEDARILPPPNPRVPVVVGGAGEVAVRRTARHGDGWLAMWCSARRYAATQREVEDACAALGREAPTFAGLNIWVGLDDDADVARGRLGERLAALYQQPADRFQHVTAAGRPEDVAAFLQPYVDAGARTISLVPVAEDAHAAIEFSGAVRRLLGAPVTA